MKFNALSIKGYIIGFFTFLTALLVLYFSIILFYKNAEKDDSYVIDVAGRNRMLSQKIGFYSEMLVRGNEAARSNLRSSVELHGKSLEMLRKGGIAPGSGGQIQLPPIPNDVIPVINEVEKGWKQFENNAYVLINQANKGSDSNTSKSVIDALHHIELNAQKMLDLNNQLVQSFVNNSAKKGVEFIVVLIVISACVLVFFIIAFRFLNANILEVLKTIGIVADDVAEGTFTNRIPDQADPYLSKISNAINDLGNNINQAALFAASIGQGKFDFQFQTTRGGNRLFDELVRMRDQLKKVSDEDKVRNWASKGLAHFADILRNDKRSIHELGDTIISECVKYIEANQGSLFIVTSEEEDQYLELLSCYAWDRKKIRNKRISKGQSLIGQCWIERGTIYLREVPSDFVDITSGLGQANPKEILIVPLMSNEEVLGVIELASFSRFESYQIEFLEKLGENIASSLSSANVMKETNLLLAQTQQQTEEMRAQEEEMRQNMEEIQATQEQMARNEEENMQEIEKLELLHKENTERYKMLALVADHTDNSVIITDKEGNIEYVNNGFSKLTGYSLEDVKGKKPGTLLQGVDTDQSTIKRIRQKINADESFYEEILNYDKDGSEYWISMSINPVFEQGKVVNYISVQANITEMKQKSLDQESQVNAVDKNLAIIEFDLNGHIQIANQNFLDAMGYQLEEIRGKHHSMFMKKNEQGEAYEQMWNDLRKGKTVSGEFQRVNKKGSLVWLKSHYTPIIDITGKTYKILKYAQDITESKKLALDFNSQMSAINKNNAVIEFNMDGTVISSNENFLETMGYSIDEIKGGHHKMFLFDEDINDEYVEMWKKLNKGVSIADDFKRKSKSGNIVWLKSIYTPIIDISGNPYKVVKYATDITGQKVMALDYRGQLEAIWRNYAVIEFDLKGNIQEVNQNFLDAIKYTKDEVIGKHHSMFVFDDDLGKGYTKMWQNLAEGKSQSAKYKRKNKDGEAIWLNSIYTPILDLSGKPYKVVKYAQRMGMIMA